MADLERILRVVAEADEREPPKILNRRFIVVEGLYQNTGLIAPLAQVVELAERFKFRVMLEESMSMGTLGVTGHGACEHHGVSVSAPSIICGTMSASLATVGGFCLGEPSVVNHQRLSSTAYCFSASLPPFNATAGIVALRLLRSEGKDRVAALRRNCVAMHKLLTAALAGSRGDGGAEGGGLWLMGDEISPVKHLHLVHSTGNRAGDEALLYQVCDEVLEKAGALLVVCDYSPLQKRAPRSSIRLTICAAHTEEQLEACAAAIGKAAARLPSA
mmetsp:Transcript_76270/g.204905  ORF Transcript_76270/g.204905 Transcript_76270/m.204905 type:complete len:274 (-) Transcript_76270:702-1523(-)